MGIAMRLLLAMFPSLGPALQNVGQAQEDEDNEAQEDKGPAPWLQKAGYLPLAALIAIIIYSWGDWDIFAVAVLLAGGATVAGGLLGFLFGIPRALAGPEQGDDADTRRGYLPNTNLEQISDWLTKILVGVGLVQFTTLARHIGDLIDFLGPSLGGEPRGRAFAGATVAVFSISGFLAFYLVTRLYLGRAFAQADRVTVLSVVKKEVRETQRDQQERDVTALMLVSRQLEPEPGAPPTPQVNLNTAVEGASPVVKAQIFSLARDQRKQFSKKDKAKMERAIPVFNALIASEKERKYHRNHAQLGYALREKAQPDFPAAEAALTEAIDLRIKAGESGFLLYEFNRALARLAQHGPDPQPDVRELIEADLKAAEKSSYLRREMEANPDIKAFRDAAPPNP
jgi:hypothetical protein